MDVLYQYYMDFLAKIGLNESIIIILWYVFPFCLAICAFFIISIFIKKIEKKLSMVINPDKKIENEIVYNKFKSGMIPFVMIFAPTIFLWGLLPYSNKYIPISSEVSSLLFVAVLFFLLFAFLLLTKKEEEKKFEISFISNILSFILPMLFSLLSVVLFASSLNLNEIVLSQAVAQRTTGWLITPAFLGFFVFILGIIGVLVLMDKKLNISQLCLFNIKNKRVKVLVLSYYSLIFMLASYCVCLFFGGYLPPLGFYLSEIYQIHYVLNTSAVYLEQICWLLLKSIILAVVIIAIKIKCMDVKEDKLVKFAWFILFPISVVNLLICMIISVL